MLKCVSTILLTMVVFVELAFANPQLPQNTDYYYGKGIASRRQQNGDLKKHLYQILNSYHIPQDNDYDRLVENCDVSQKNCYAHKDLGYKIARRHLFGEIDLESYRSISDLFIVSTYCQEVVDQSHFSGSQGLGPMKIPDPRVLNTEHSWPQSRFVGGFPKSMQKSDLHALYPVKMQVNSIRGNYPFGEVVEIEKSPCQSADLGKNSGGQIVFEPEDSVKGNLARSIFYFSTRYRAKIDQRQEGILRQWHHMDPPDQKEVERSNEIFKVQHVRNPYVDHPEWVDEISDF
jgi:deoxyribonuclease-1